MAIELLAEYEEQFHSLPAKWYESEVNRDWVFIVSVLAILLPYTFSLATNILEGEINNSHISTSFISLIYFTFSLILDKYTTYQGFKLSDELRQNGFDSPISELNPDLNHVFSKEDYLKELVRVKDVLALMLSISPVLGVPMAAQRSLAGLNNIRVVKRTRNAYEGYNKSKEDY